LALAYGGTIQVIAGILEFPRGNTLGSVAFLAYGGFFWSLAMIYWLFPSEATGSVLAWYYLVWGVTMLYVSYCALSQGIMQFLPYLALWVTFGLLALGTFTGSRDIVDLGGYVGLATAILAFYASFAHLVGGSEALRVFGRRSDQAAAKSA